MFRAIATTVFRGGLAAANQVNIQPTLITASRPVVFSVPASLKTAVNSVTISRTYHAVIPQTFMPTTGLLGFIQPHFASNQIRTVTKFSLKTGKRKTVKSVLKRFLRLDWGIWIRTLAGRKKRLWTKTPANKRRLRQHVFCNATQSTLLDKMVNKGWKRRRYYVDDPYAPYHSREEFPFTRRKPKGL